MRVTRAEREHPAYQWGRDRDFLEWLSYQPSAVDRSWNQWDSERGCGRNIAAHVRRVNRGAGLGIKPPFSAIPLTHTQHLNEDAYPIEWRIEQADIHLERWIAAKKSTLF